MHRMALFTLLTLFTCSAFAGNLPMQANIGCTITAPPFVIIESDRGIVIDIMRAAFANQNIQSHFSYGSKSLNNEAFINGEIDALCITRGEVSAPIYFATEPVVSFKNSAITLKTNGIHLKKISDLSRYRVYGFHMSSIMLPSEYSQAVDGSPLYQEFENQIEQVKALFLGEVEVVIIGKPIFQFYLSKLRRSDPSNPLLYQQYSATDLFDPAVYYPAFRTEKLRDEYDKGFKQLKESGELERIHSAYQLLIDRYFFSSEQ